MDHGNYRELAAGAALDDLDPTERASLDAHVAACAPCRADARALVDTAGMLAYAVPHRTAPASLRGSVLGAIAASENRPVGIPAASLAYAGGTTAGSIVAPAGPSPARPNDMQPALPAAPAAAAPDAVAPAAADGNLIELETLRRDRTRYRRLSLTGLAVAAALAVAVGALGATAAGMSAELETATLERDAAVAQLATTDEAMAVALAPDHLTATLTPDPLAGEATVFVVYRPGTTEAWMMAGNLPATPEGKVYQLWSSDAAGVHALTTFTCADTQTCLAPFGVDLASAKATMVTLEPAGGAQGDPGPQVAFGELEG